MKILRFLVVLPLILLVFSCSEKTTELIQLDDPIFNPASGTYFPGQVITITCPEYGATIRYTVDGSDPTDQSTVYDPNSPLTVNNFFPAGETTATLKARAYKEGFDPSNTVEAIYTVEFFNTVGTPHFSPLSGDIQTSNDIYIICSTLNAAIHYTLDGTDPTPGSTLYEDPFQITQTGEVTLKARGYRENWNPSEIASTTYNVSGK